MKSVDKSGVEIDHLGIAVRSLKEGLRFYERSLGIHLAHCETVAHEKVSVAMLPLSGAVDPPRIELLEASGPESPIARFIEKRGPGLHHIAFRVDHLPSLIAQLVEEGVEVLGKPKVGAEGRLYVFVHPASTGGVLIELIQK